MMYLIFLLAILVPGLGVQAHWTYKRRQLLKGSWGNVLAPVENVDIEGFMAIAEGYLQPDNHQLRIEPSRMWHIVGGFKGLARMQSNADAMLNLAVYSERWNLAHESVVSDLIRRDTVRLNNAIAKVRLRYFFGFGVLRTAFHIQEAVVSYYLLRSRLFGLYQHAHVGLLPGLEGAV